jgi:hypothetical protein
MKIVTSNGLIGMGYDSESKVITDVHLGLDSSEINIKSIELGFVYKNKIYRLKDYNFKIELIDGTNIISLKALVDDKYKYEAFIYASMVNKDRLVIESKVEGIDNMVLNDIRFFYYIRPLEDKKNVIGYNFYYSYDNIYFKSVEESLDLLFTNDEMLKEQKFIPFSGEGIKEKEMALFFIESSSNQENKNTFVISWNNFNFAMNLVNYSKEEKYWKDYLKDINAIKVRNAFAILKSYQRRDGSIYNFNKNTGYIYVSDMISAINSFMDYGFFEDSKMTMRYLINSKSGMKKNSYMISNYAYDFDRKEIFKSDRYGEMLNIINSAEFLECFCRYYYLSRDMDFLEENIEEIEAKVGNYLVDIVDNYGVKENSGRYRIGIGRGRRYFESQTAVYKALGKFIGILDLLEKDKEAYIEVLSKIKRNINNYIIDDEILSYPNENKLSDKETYNLYGIHRDYFDENKMRLIIENEFMKIEKYKDRTLLEQAEFINFLYEFDYVEKGDIMRKSLLGKLDRSKNYATYQMQNSIEFIYEYLSLLKKE